MFKLVVPNINPDTFSRYWYGYGIIESMVEGSFPGTFTYTVDYGSDEYRCRYQDGRFASGLHFSKGGGYKLKLKYFTGNRIAALIVSLLIPGPWTIALIVYCLLVPVKEDK